MKRVVGVLALTLTITALTGAPALASVSTTTAPSLSGTAAAGGTLTCGNVAASGWTTSDVGTPTLYDYQWYYASNETPGDEIYDALGYTGTPSATYTVQAADIGQHIVCEQIDIDGGAGDGTTTSSPPSTATKSVVAGQPPTSSGTLAVTGAVEVGGTLTCDDSAVTWAPSAGSDGSVSTNFTWQYAGGGVPAGTPANESTYTPVPEDLGKTLLCRETGTDTGTGGSATLTSPATMTVAPEPAVTITEYSPAISGSIGENVAGVDVTATLERVNAAQSETAVATGTAATTASGSWSLTLSPAVGSTADAFGASGDQLVIGYKLGSAPAATVLPVADTFQDGVNVLFDTTSSINASGTTVSSDAATDCTSLAYIVDGTSEPTVASAGGCQYAPKTALTDNDHVEAAETGPQTVDASGDLASVTTIDDVGLLGVPSAIGPPTCTADYVYGTVTCSGLNGSGFSVTTTGVKMNLTTVADATGTSYTGYATLTGLTSGETITLNESGRASNLSVLHVGTLRVDEGLQSSGAATTQVSVANGGACSPNRIVGGQLCPATGVMPSDLGTIEFDDLSGGDTMVDIPSLTDLIPTPNASLPPANWNAYADIVGADTNPAPASGVDLAAVRSITLELVPHGSGVPLVTTAMTPGQDPDSAFETATVTGPLPGGRYWADFLLTDSHGDTAAFSDLFAQQSAGSTGASGSQGPPGPAGPTGATGPQGPIGAAGAPGVAAAVGAQGPPGNNGAAGANGTAGPQGPPGTLGSQGPVGPQGSQGVQGPKGNTGATGKIELVTCTIPAKKHKRKTCTTSLVSGPVTVAASTGSATNASLSSRGHLYATGRVSHGELVLRSTHRLARGRYTLVLTRGKRVIKQVNVTVA